MQTIEPIFFKFESDFVASLRCIPMVVRYKLDTCGIKLKLDQWNHFSEADRQQLVDYACNTPEETALYRQALSDLIWQRTQTPASELPIQEHPDWMEADNIPLSVQEKAQSIGSFLELEQWRSLNPLQRFALIKLSRSSHENRNFEPALREFQLWPRKVSFIDL
jgi:hypothetical protein